jgi:Leucine-rich repeat (LRR) protein
VAATAWVVGALAGCSGGPRDAASSDSTAEGAWSEAELDRVRSGEQTALTAPNATVTDADLAKLARLTKLERLQLDNVKITDAGLAHLGGLTKLKALHVVDQEPGHCAIGDAGIKALAAMSELEELLLPSPNATDAAADVLAKLEKLRFLNLGKTQLTAAGVAKLVSLSKLELLRLGGAHIDDASLEHIGKMTTLKHLLLHDAPITDGGLPQLLTLDKLELLQIDRTQVSEKGLSKVAEKKPQWHHIHLDDAHVGGDHDQ